MKYLVVYVLVSAGLTGCGLGETAVSGAAGAAVEVHQAQEGRALQARVQGAVNSAASADAERRAAAEAAAQ